MLQELLGSRAWSLSPQQLFYLLGNAKQRRIAVGFADGLKADWCWMYRSQDR